MSLKPHLRVDELAIISPVPLCELGYGDWIQHAVGDLACLRFRVVHDAASSSTLADRSAALNRRADCKACGSSKK